MVDVLERKKLNYKNYHFQELCFLKVSSISSTSGKPHLSLILANLGLAIVVRNGTVMNIVPFMTTLPCADREGDRGSRLPLENRSYMGFYRN